jgi:cardiolipin synthase
MKNIPNILTVFRLALVPVFVIVFFSEIHNNTLWALFIYVVAGVTDVLDGYIARKYDIITEIGTVLDPLADKIMLIAAVVCLGIIGRVPFLAVLIVTVKESFMIVSGLILYYRKEKLVIPSNKYGKIATVLISISILLLILLPTSNIALYLLYFTIAFKLLALFKYYIAYSNKIKGGI